MARSRTVGSPPAASGALPCLGGRPPARILLEASTEREWVARHLASLGHEVIVADSNYAPMSGNRSRRTTTDKRDARTVMDSCATGAWRFVTQPGPSTSWKEWHRPLSQTHPTAPGPSRPTHEREEKAAQHLEDRVDHRSTRDGKPRANTFGLDVSRRFTEGNSIGVGRVNDAITDRAKTDSAKTDSGDPSAAPVGLTPTPNVPAGRRSNDQPCTRDHSRVTKLPPSCCQVTRARCSDMAVHSVVCEDGRGSS